MGAAYEIKVFEVLIPSTRSCIAYEVLLSSHSHCLRIQYELHVDVICAITRDIWDICKLAPLAEVFICQTLWLIA